ncbi:MAG TPA: SgcJ/EcaC family oxidoreductase [Candidatus Baltobacteraceae bacterium]|nr:SgcJ/EcaC family oxidoreductase [Candidatus Baltobacteraceae bacterium]
MRDWDDSDRAALESIADRLAQAWNSGDAGGFAAPFAADAQQVNIFGTRLIGRDEIRDRHAAVFAEMFRESTNVLQILDARRLGPDVLLAQISSAVEVPHGPLRGTLRTIASLVLRRVHGADWEIVLFHNTRQQPGPPSNT